MQRIAEVLVESYLANNMRQYVPRRVAILSFVKKFARGSLQYIGIMMSLVGASLITKMFETSYQPLIIVNETQPNAIESEKKNHMQLEV